MRFLVAVGERGQRLRTPAFDAGFKRLAHRGPDGDTHREVSLAWGHASLSVCRLAITGGPMADEASHTMTARGERVIAFNGEIYNHRDLRAELDEYTWRTECDTEVVLHAWDRWREHCVDHLNGMFAFVIVDPARDTVFAARDRAGEKPLYYAQRGDVTYFASEIKAMPFPLVEVECADMRVLEFDFRAATPFKDVFALEPGRCLRIGGSRHLELSTYWTLPQPDTASNAPWLLDDLTGTLVDAVRIRARTDRPVAALVSGGLDSAIIHAIAQTEHLYTVGFADVDLDEVLDSAGLAVSGYLHDPSPPHVVSFGLDGARERLGDIAYHLDTPATWTALAQWFLASAIRREHGSGTVVLTGEGADETFAGYARYKVLSHIDSMRSDPALADYSPLQHHLFGGDIDILTRLLNRATPGAFTEHARDIVSTFANGPSLVRSAMRLDWHTTMQCLLRMLDRMMAAHQLEARCPFLDHRVVELAAQLPSRWLIDDYGTKLALREIARRLGVHRSITDEQRKRGFYVPWNKWTNGARGSRGAWDRGDFAKTMRQAWLDHGPAGRMRASQ